MRDGSAVLQNADISGSSRYFAGDRADVNDSGSESPTDATPARHKSIPTYVDGVV